MAIDYNANLISELYAAKDDEHATRISDEMVDIGDPIFPRQIYEAYKKFKSSTKSHYFVQDLTEFKSTDAAEILKEIARTTERSADLHMMIGYLADIGYFEIKVSDKIASLFQKETDDSDLSEYDIYSYVKYLSKTELGKEILCPNLQTCFEDEGQDLPTRKAALEKLLEIDKKTYLSFYLENYELIKNKRAEVIFVQEIAGWSGGIISQIHKKILESGSATAKEILQKKLQKKEAQKQLQEKDEQQKVSSVFTNADLVNEISTLRVQINRISIADQRFGFPFFIPNEEFYSQSKPAQDKDSFVGCCMVLRVVVQGYVENIKGISVSEDEFKKYLPNVKALDGSLNKFHFLLYDKQVPVDATLFGMRDVSRLVSKIAHPNVDTEIELIDLLKSEGLEKIYASGDFSKLHREILSRYRDSLEKLTRSLTNSKLPEIK
jgi:hypothetical protein